MVEVPVVGDAASFVREECSSLAIVSASSGKDWTARAQLKE